MKSASLPQKVKKINYIDSKNDGIIVYPIQYISMTCNMTTMADGWPPVHRMAPSSYSTLIRQRMLRSRLHSRHIMDLYGRYVGVIHDLEIYWHHVHLRRGCRCGDRRGRMSGRR